MAKPKLNFAGCLFWAIVIFSCNTGLSQQSEELDFDYIPKEIIVAEKRAEVKDLDLLSEIGLTVGPVRPDVLRTLEMKHAVAITGLRPNSISTQLDLKVGDVVVRLNGQPVQGPDDFASKLKSAFLDGKDNATIGLTRLPVSSRHVVLPFPSYGGRYSPADKAYEFEIPDGWYLVGGRRNTALDPGFDSLFSPDLQTILIMARNGIPVTNPIVQLNEYRREKVSQAQQYHDVRSESLIIADSIGFRVSYRHATNPVSVSRVAFVNSRNRYVINAVFKGVTDTNLSDSVQSVLDSISCTE